MASEIQRVNETTTKSANASSLGGDLLAELKNVSPQERAKLFGGQRDMLLAQGPAESLKLDNNFTRTIDKLVREYENSMDKKELAPLKKALENTVAGNRDGLVNAVPCSSNSMGGKVQGTFESILTDAGFKVKSIGFEAKHIGGSKFGALTILPPGSDTGLKISYSKGEGENATGKSVFESVRINEHGKIIERTEEPDKVRSITNRISSDFKLWLKNKQN
jgi:hypothetical protein